MILTVLTKQLNKAASNLANDIDVVWENELNSPGAMALYENWVRLAMIILLYYLFIFNY